MKQTKSSVSAANHRGAVLAVDDDALTLTTLRMVLSSFGFQVEVAHDGFEAQKKIEGHNPQHFECVLTDYRMPNMTGLNLMQWIQSQDATLATVMLTGEGEKQLVQEALRGGALDYIEKPFGVEQVTQSVLNGVQTTRSRRSLDSVVSDVRSLSEVHSKLNRNVRGQRIAALDEKISVTTQVYPIKETGGDFFNTWSLDDHRLFILVGDVSGHDLRAGYVSAYFQGIARGMLETNSNIEEISRFFNRYLIHEWNLSEGEDKYSIITSLAACALIVDLKNYSLSIHNNGVPRPFLMNGNSANWAGKTAPPLGWYDPLLSEFTVQELEKWGYGYMWTDGLEDVARAQGISQFALAYTLLRDKNLTSESDIIASRQDDILLLRFDWFSEGAKSSQEVLFFETYSGDEAHKVDQFQKLWQASLMWVFPKLPHDKLMQILLCMREALLNALQHGCQGNSALHAKLLIFLIPNDSILRICVADEGTGYDPDNSNSGKTNAEGHTSFGLILLREYTDRLEISKNGTVIDFYFGI